MPPLETLALVPFTPQVHQQVVKLHVDRKMSPPPMAKMAVAAVGRGGAVCASMYLYETDLFLFIEFLCTNPAYPARQRHAAVLLLSHAVVALALTKGLFVMATPRTRGGELIAKRMGFKDSGMPMWVRKADPMPLWMDQPPEVSPGPKSAPRETEGPGSVESDVDWGPDGGGPEPESEKPEAMPLAKARALRKTIEHIGGPEPEKSRAPVAAKGRRRGKETAEAPARKTLQRVSRQGNRSGLG